MMWIFRCFWNAYFDVLEERNRKNADPLGGPGGGDEPEEGR